MAFTQIDLDTLDAAIATGALVVQFQDRRVQYQTTDQMLRARTLIAGTLNPRTIVRQIRMETSKGI